MLELTLAQILFGMCGGALVLTGIVCSLTLLIYFPYKLKELLKIALQYQMTKKLIKEGANRELRGILIKWALKNAPEGSLDDKVKSVEKLFVILKKADKNKT